MPEAARLGDLIGHAPPIPPVVAAAAAGGAVASGAAGAVGGGLTSAANAGADAASGGSGGGGSGVGGVVTGKIIGPCSGNVFINGIPAARALVDQAICSLHLPVPLPIVSGSSNVFINGLPAARLGDRIFCGAIILSGSGNVFIGGSAGGESVSTDMAMPEGSISPLQCDGILMADAGATNPFGGPADSAYMQWRATAAAPFKAGNLQSQLVPIGRVESFFMFHPVGRFMKGWSAGVLDIGNLQRNVVLREWSHIADAYGYGKEAILGPEKGVMGDVRSYQPKSQLLKSVEQNGIANTLGGAFHNGVLGGTGLSTLQAIGSRDPETIGRAGPGILLAGAGGSIASRIGTGTTLEAARMSGGLRRSPNVHLSEADVSRLAKEFTELGGDPSKLRFNSGRQTSYVDEADIFRVRGDVLPLEGALHPRSSMSSRATLAHELGHQAHRGTNVPIGAWNDEFRASYWAAKNAPALSSAERVSLLSDALMRAREAGVPVRMNKYMRDTLYGYE